MLLCILLLKIALAVGKSMPKNPQVVTYIKTTTINKSKNASVDGKPVAGEVDIKKTTPTGTARFQYTAGSRSNPSPPYGMMKARKMNLGAVQKMSLYNDLDSLYNSVKDKLSIQEFTTSVVMEAYENLIKNSNDVAKYDMVTYLISEDNEKRMFRISEKGDYIQRKLVEDSRPKNVRILSVSQLAKYILNNLQGAKRGKESAVANVLLFTQEILSLYVNGKTDIRAAEDYVNFEHSSSVTY